MVFDYPNFSVFGDTNELLNDFLDFDELWDFPDYCHELLDDYWHLDHSLHDGLHWNQFLNDYLDLFPLRDVLRDDLLDDHLHLSYYFHLHDLLYLHHFHDLFYHLNHFLNDGGDLHDLLNDLLDLDDFLYGDLHNLDDFHGDVNRLVDERDFGYFDYLFNDLFHWDEFGDLHNPLNDLLHNPLNLPEGFGTGLIEPKQLIQALEGIHILMHTLQQPRIQVRRLPTLLELGQDCLQHGPQMQLRLTPVRGSRGILNSDGLRYEMEDRLDVGEVADLPPGLFEHGPDVAADQLVFELRVFVADLFDLDDYLAE